MRWSGPEQELPVRMGSLGSELRLSPVSAPLETLILCRHTGPLDTVDNDGDGRINEDHVDGIDDDGDGLVDEDWIGGNSEPETKFIRDSD